MPPQTEILTCPNTAESTIRLFAEIIKVCEGETITRVLDVVVLRVGDSKVVIESLVHQSLGAEWCVKSVWVPELEIDEF